MPRFTTISIIYNPNSTRASKTLAEELRSKLAESMPGQSVKLFRTNYAGHAEVLALELAKESASQLIISSSGDGGYHEVVNGIMQAQLKGARPVAGLLPGGNANDHYHHIHDIAINRAIELGVERKIDLLKMTATVNGKPFERYAHSYIGIGLTPEAGNELNKVHLNLLKEIWLVIKVIFILQPVNIIIKDRKHSYYSLIFSNVAKMSKYMSVSKKAKIDDGIFEVTPFIYKNRLRLIMNLLRAGTARLPGNNQSTEFIFNTTDPLLVQMDGEITKIDSDSKVTISVERKILRCIV